MDKPIQPKLKSILRKRRYKAVARVNTNLPKTEAIPTPSKPNIKFAGAVKILVIEPKSEYCKTVWCAIGVFLTHIAVGAVTMSVLHYSLKTGDAHAILCCTAIHIDFVVMYVYVLNPGGRYCNYVFCGIGIGFIQSALGAFLMIVICYYVQDNDADPHVLFCALGLHFFMAEGLLSLHYANGWTAPMRLRHRRFAHIFLNVFGILCVIIGASIATVNRGFSLNPHGLTGMITTVLVLISAFLGPFSYYTARTSKIPTALHMGFGIATFLMSSICIFFGVTLDTFQNWASDGIVIITVALVAFYTAFIVISAFMKCVTRL